jgi:hypothetical protein
MCANSFELPGGRQERRLQPGLANVIDLRAFVTGRTQWSLTRPGSGLWEIAADYRPTVFSYML